MDYFNDVLTTFQGLECSNYVAVHAWLITEYLINLTPFASKLIFRYVVKHNPLNKRTQLSKASVL